MSHPNSPIERSSFGAAMLPLAALPLVAGAAYMLPVGGAVTLIAISLPIMVAGFLLTLTFAEARGQRRDIQSLETELAIERERASELDTVVAQLHEGVVIVELDSDIVTFMSARAVELIGRHASLPIALSIGLAPKPQRRAGDRVHPEGAPFAAEVNGRHVDCAIRPMPVLDGRRRVALIITDATARHRQELRLTHLLTHDRVTGLLDREALRRTLVSRLESRDSHGPVALLVLDIDGFRAINARLGDTFGDRVLNAFGRRLKRTVRSADVVARVDGDMFAVLQSNAGDAAQVQPLADRLRAELSKPLLVDDIEVELPVTIGAAIASVAMHEITADQVLAQAEVALMEAKAVDGGQFKLHNDID